MLKESYSRFMLLTDIWKSTFDLPVNKNEDLYNAFSEYNQYVRYVIDLHYHMIQVEYPIEQNKAHELACKMFYHNQTLLDEKLKPSIGNLIRLFPKDKELEWMENYINILYFLNISLKWLCRGLGHHRTEEK